MRIHPFRRHDELAVLISLLVSVGMLVGTLVTVWMWTIVSERVSTVIERGPDIP